DSERAEVLAPRVRHAWLTSDQWQVFPDVVPALTALQQAGWRHSIISNSFPELRQVVDQLGIGHFFFDVISSANVGYEKPHPEIFRLALRRADHPEVTWMVGNSPDRD